MRRVFSALIGLQMLFCLPIRAQEEPSKLFARKTTALITADGVLNESIWRRAENVNRLIVLQPDRYTPEKVQTSVKVVFDEKTLYVGIVCLDSEPDKIKGDVTVRDGDVRVDDSVFVLLDLFDNLDSYYFFATNPTGVQTDGLLRKDGQVANPQWHGDWEVGAQRTENGWTAEFSINFTTLMYQPIEGESMGIRISRVVPRLDSTFWSEPMDPALRVSDIEVLPQLTFALIEKLVEFIPFVMPRYQSGEGAGFQIGLNIPVKFTQRLRSHITVNPDFLTAEPDVERFNLTRYELDLPEKRDYLQDSQDLFGVEHEKLFYSKRMGDLYGGAKFQGELGAYELSAMSNQTKKIDETGGETANFSVVRLNRKFGKKSYVGILAANKMQSSENTGTAGLNASLALTDQFSVSGQFAASYGRESQDNLTFSVVPSYDTETFHFHVGFSQVGEKFGDNANSVGFVWDDDRREIDTGLHKYFVLQKWGIEHIKYNSRYNAYWGTDGILRSWHVDQGISLVKQNLFELSFVHTQEYKLFEKEYRNIRTRIFLGLDTREWTLFNIILTWGKNFGRTFRLGEINKRLNISPKLSVEYAFQFLTNPDIGGNRVDKYWMFHLIKATHNFTRFLSLKGFVQYNEQAKKTNYQAFLHFRFRPPAGLLQVGIQKGDPRYGRLELDDTTLYIKCSYAF
jgi:hypothetical protein